jgi:Flp pilus assembly protein TadG
MSHWRDEEGTAALEMAFMLLILVPVLLGVLNLGHALYVRVQVQEAAQEGAMYAVYAPDTPAATRTRVIASTPNVVLTNVAVTCPAAGIVAVTVTHPHQWITSAPFLGAFTMTARVTGDLVSTRPCVGG